MIKILDNLDREIQVHKLTELGWEFMMTSPNEFQWLKFDGNKCIGHQGDAVWKADNESL